MNFLRGLVKGFLWVLPALPIIWVVNTYLLVGQAPSIVLAANCGMGAIIGAIAMRIK